jgi:DNA-binding NarL/FixJ family response regulator
VVVMDYSLPLLNGVEALRQIKSRLPDTEILIFTMHDSDEIIGLALDAGARSYLLKSDAKRFLISAVESLVNHKPFFIGRLSEKLLDSFLSKEKPNNSRKLSPRERIVVQLVAEGHSNKQIGAILNVSVKTVETQRASAMKKLNAKSTSALVRYAIRSKLIEA